MRTGSPPGLILQLTKSWKLVAKGLSKWLPKENGEGYSPKQLAVNINGSFYPEAMNYDGKNLKTKSGGWFLVLPLVALKTQAVLNSSKD